jgi:hypothetical protein
MSKEINVVKKNLPAAIADLVNIGQNATATRGELGTGDAFGKFTKQGNWEFGQEGIEIEEDSKWAVNPLSMRHGYIHWPGEGRPREIMVPLTDPLPTESELPDVDGEWNTTFSFQALCVEGEDKGQQVIFKGPSLGFKKAATKMANAISARAAEKRLDVMPIVSLESTSYQHKQYGKIMEPVIAIVEWKNLDGAAAEADTEEQEPEPKTPPSAPEDKAPPRRRRRVRQ